MNTNLPVNQTPYLRTSRDFSDEGDNLTKELSKSYIDISNAVNDRTIGIYTTDRPSITGNSWFLNSSQKKQTMRQIYQITAFTNVPHGINFQDIEGFTHIYGSFTDGTDWYPIPLVNSSATGNQVSIHITSTDIVLIAGGSAPSITKGFIVLEWLTFSPSLV